MGVFVGIIVGFLGVNLFNKYYNYDKLFEVFLFFNGKCFVLFVVIGGLVVMVLFLFIVWLFI